MGAEVWLPMRECESCGAECVQSPCWMCVTWERELEELREQLEPLDDGPDDTFDDPYVAANEVLSNVVRVPRE